MYNHTDFRQVVGEVKERNRIHMALSKIREIAMTINPDDISDDVRESLMLIIKLWFSAPSTSPRGFTCLF